VIDDHSGCIEMGDDGNGCVDMSVLALFGMAFLVLKLTHVISWSWLWVTAPFWGVFVLLAAVALIALISAATSVAIEGIAR
jgi:phosphoglycerol transferase MdoB-like AlkP superfamily enzyme